MRRLSTVAAACFLLSPVVALAEEQAGAKNDTAGHGELKMVEEPEGLKEATETTVEEAAEIVGSAYEYTAEATHEAYMAMRNAMNDDEKDAISTLVQKASSPVVLMGKYAYLTHSAITARELTGAEVTGAEGEVIAKVVDVVLRDHSVPELLVLSSGGLLGIGDKQTSVDYNEATYTPEYADHPKIKLSMTDAGLKTAQEFDAGQLAEDRLLMSQLIGVDVTFANSGETAQIHDVLMDKDGQIVSLIMHHDNVIGVGDKKFLIDIEELEFSGGRYSFNLTPSWMRRVGTVVYDIDDFNADRRQIWYVAPALPQ